ncbi:preprotein translocase subunit SecE [Candidatus Gracilibacteria bacterium]|nr:MAG: preprotein translocase subunit SecE [Candidatus Gracilibacteria bacterium]
MFTFFKEAIRELEHVVWPTPKETRKYMNYNIGVIIVVTLILSILGIIITTGLSELRNITYQGPKNTIINDANTDATRGDLENLKNILSGSIQASGEAKGNTPELRLDTSPEVLPTVEDTTTSGTSQ